MSSQGHGGQGVQGQGVVQGVQGVVQGVQGVQGHTNTSTTTSTSSNLGDKTFHLKWNNHLQNLRTLFTGLYTTDTLADVTLCCRDGSVRCHRLVLSACSPYFERIFLENPCQHPVVILKGIPFQEIHLLVEFMYKGSVDVQELDLQSLMHTAAELEVRGLARDPAPPPAPKLETPPTPPRQRQPTRVTPAPNPSTAERRRQIDEYQRTVCSAPAPSSSPLPNSTAAPLHNRDTRFKGKKRVSVGLDVDYGERGITKKTPIQKIPIKEPGEIVSAEPGEIVQCTADVYSHAEVEEAASSEPDTCDENNITAETVYDVPEEEDYDSSESVPEFTPQKPGEKMFKCDLCELRFNRSSHLSRHRRTHTGEKPYRCEACGRSFARGDKLKLHQRICEKDEYVAPPHAVIPTAHHTPDPITSDTVVPGMVSMGHSERHHLMFTPSGDVMLATDTLGSADGWHSGDSYYQIDSNGCPIKRGRGRPRKKPLPPPDMPLIKKRRGRPPKIIKMEPDGTPTPVENYNASNLPFGDFSYLTDIISTHFDQTQAMAYHNLLQANQIINTNTNTNTNNTAPSSSNNTQMAPPPVTSTANSETKAPAGVQVYTNNKVQTIQVPRTLEIIPVKIPDNKDKELQDNAAVAVAVAPPPPNETKSESSELNNIAAITKVQDNAA